jgi:GH15 family glucan-1,4-alpha-glucosidase
MNEYPAIERLGVTGDRRTAAMVAADGTINWLCFPNYDGKSIFGALLDRQRGGFWRMGPPSPGSGEQSYRNGTPVLVTRWEDNDGVLELTDLMPWPQTDRASGREASRAVIRRLRCQAGRAEGAFRLRPQPDFKTTEDIGTVSGGILIKDGGLSLGLWTSRPVSIGGDELRAVMELEQGEEFWAVLTLDEAPDLWDVDRTRQELVETERYWRDWTSGLTYTGPRKENVLRSAINFHLLSFAPTGSLVAAPTTSLPERIGGDRNYDYRFAWIRDVSLSLAILSVLGDLKAAERYMDWLAKLESSTEMPLQVLYRIDGGTDATQHRREDLEGYKGSRPVSFGNHAFRQRQFDSFGYLADCAHIYLQQGGRWKSEYWTLIRQVADYTAENWSKADNGIWELDEQRHYVSSKVMSWVTLERAVRTAEKLGIDENEAGRWRSIMEQIHAEVMDRGWSEERQSFRQHYDSDALDASALLIATMRFLPPEHPRVLATIDRIAADLTIGGLIYRFDPRDLPGATEALGEFEGAFLPCTFWMAASLAMAGRAEEAEAILERVEEISGPLELLAEEADPRTGTFLGNTPLLFSHAEYVKAVLSLAKARPLDAARLMTGMAARRVKQWVGGQ